MASLAQFLQLLENPEMALAAQKAAAGPTMEQRQMAAFDKLSEPKVEDTVEISGPPITQGSYLVNSGGEGNIKQGPADFAKKNFNLSLQDTAGALEDAQKRAEMAQGQSQESRNKLKSLYDNVLSQGGPAYQSKNLPLLQEQMRNLNESQQQKPESNLLSNAILALGPALLGSGLGFGGQSGRIAAAQTGKMTVPMISKNREEAIKALQSKRDSLAKQVQSLLAYEKLDQESFNDDARNKMNQAKMLIDAGQDMAKWDQQTLKNYNDQVDKLNKDFSNTRTDAIKTVTSAETQGNAQDLSKEKFKMDLDQREKERLSREKMNRERVSAAKQSAVSRGAQIPLDQRKMVENLSTRKANIMTVTSQIDELNKQLKDKSIPESERVASGLEQLKLLNSLQGPDAVGEGEAKRLAGYLQWKPDPFGPKGFKLGFDVDSYSRQLDRILERQRGTLKSIGTEIDKNMGRPTQAPSSQNNAPKQEMTREQKIQLLRAKGLK